MTHKPINFARRGFTLIELTMALVVTTVLVGAVGSLVVMTTRAAAGNPRALSNSAGAAEAIDRFVAELSCAITVSEATSSAVSFTVADRNNDAQPETIRYSWAGAGTPLRRELNAAAAVNVTGNLAQLNLAYTTTKQTTTSSVTNSVDSGEVLLSSFTGWTGITPTIRELALTPAFQATQFFRIDKVSLPSTLTSLRLTKVRLMMRKGTGTNNYTVAIQGPGAGPQPDAVNRGSPVTTPAAALGATMGWVDVPLPDTTFSSKLTDFNIVVKGTGANSGLVRYLDGAGAPADVPVFLYSTDSGSSWLPASGRNRYDMPYEVWGSYISTSTTNVDIDIYTLHSVSVTVQPSGATSPAVTKVRTLNRPFAPATVTASADPVPSL
jgi:prepilin-type N-terminal cleavage/methylation domain-containing protein